MPLTKLKTELWPYVQIARIDHWFKNAFMLLGVLLAVFYQPWLLSVSSAGRLGLALLATCLVASSNYVINEYLDAPQDRFHPVKRNRPAAAGKIHPVLAAAEWLGFGGVGLGLAFAVGSAFGISALGLWIMGIAYNVRPLRAKELAYLDVLSESVNNPLRLLLGWFALIPDVLPPLSLILSYWMAGAFFMAIKRFAELRRIADPAAAAGYRKSFRHYTEDRLLVSTFFYATACALFAGIFIVRYHVELILFTPFAAGFFAYYLKIGLEDDSPVQRPEKLHKVRGFLLYSLLCALAFVALMFVEIPALYHWFNVEPSNTDPLWRIGPAGPGP